MNVEVWLPPDEGEGWQHSVLTRLRAAEAEAWVEQVEASLQSRGQGTGQVPGSRELDVADPHTGLAAASAPRLPKSNLATT